MQINPAQKDQLNALLNDWRLTPATFAQKISRGSWIAKPFLQKISAKVAMGIARGNARIIISAPPRHGKSELTSVNMPAWVLERFPSYPVILATYGADLSVGFGRRVRDIFLDEQNQQILRTRIRRDSSRVAAFQTDQGGSMYSVGLGGPITGRGAKVLLIDDYIKEIKEALSPAYRDYIWNWFVTTAYTRLEPGGSVIIVATRWHSDDLIGRILKNFPGEWEYIEVPAIAGENDLMGRAPGEPLFEERYPLSRLNELRTTLGSIFFQALFQQRPVDETSKLSDGNWLRIVDTVPHKQLKLARVWDCASTPDGGDYTVGALCGWDASTADFYILNIIKKQLSPGGVEILIRSTALADGTDVEVYIEQEPGSSGKALVEHFTTTVLPEFTVKPVPATKTKVIRAQPLLAAAEAGRVNLLTGPWVDAYIAEFDSFPGVFDDQVDTTSAGYTLLSGRKVYSAAWGRNKKTPTAANSRAIARASFGLSVSSQPSKSTFGRR